MIRADSWDSRAVDWGSIAYSPKPVDLTFRRRYRNAVPTAITWPAVVVLGVVCTSLYAAESVMPATNNPPPTARLVFFDGPLWDISDEGLPYRLTLAVPVVRSLDARWLRAAETRWTVGIGYAVAYDNFDTGSNTITAIGRDGPMLNAGRQYVWPLPIRIVGGRLRLEAEAGLNYGFRKMPSNGSNWSFSVISGVEWASSRSARQWFAGVRWFHLSHGGLFGPNGGYDGLVFRLGRAVRF